MDSLNSDILNSDGLVLGASASKDGLNVRNRLAAFERLCPISGDIFADLGCGTGAYSAAIIAHQPKKIILVDIDEHNIQTCKDTLASVPTRTEKVFIVSPLETLAIEEETIDCIFIIEVLDHVHDVAMCLSRAYSFLKPGGKIYIAVPNRLFPFETHPVKWRKKLYLPYLFPFLPWFPPLHANMATARLFSAATIKSLAKNAGFQKPAITYIMPPFEHRKSNMLRFISRILERSPFRCFGVSMCAVMIKHVV